MQVKKQNRYGRLLKNIMLLFTGNFVSKVLSFFMVPLYTSILSTSDYGIADLITTTVLLVLPFFSLLMDESVMRFTLDKAFDTRQVFSIGITISTIGFVAAMLLSPVIFLFETLREYYWFIVFYYVVSWIYNIVSSYVRGMDKLALTTAAGLIHTFTYLLFNILFLLVLKIGVYGYLLAMNLSNLVAIIFLVLTTKLYKNFIPLLQLDTKLAKDMVRYSVPMIPNYISWWFNNCADRYMVSYFCGTSITGIYSVAYKIPTILSSITSIFSSAWKISSVDNFGSQESIEFYNRTYKFYSGLLLIGAGALILITKFLALLLFANDFFAAWKITPILIIAYTLSALAQFIESIFNASKKTQTLFYASLIGAIVNIILNFVMIPIWGGIGAAIATVIGYFTIWIIDMFNAKKLFTMHYDIARILLCYVILILEIMAIYSESIEGYIIAIVGVISVLVINREVLSDIINLLS